MFILLVWYIVMFGKCVFPLRRGPTWEYQPLHWTLNAHRKSYRTSKPRSLVNKYNRATMDIKITERVQNQRRSDLLNSTQIHNNSLTEKTCGNTTNEEKHGSAETDADKSEVSEQTTPPRIAREISADRIWDIVRIWMIVYIVLAVPLWCTIGRCCCCLACKCFKAQETIREAKQYAMWNPPGVLRKKSGDINYTPSVKEQEAYEELEHLIRTL